MCGIVGVAGNIGIKGDKALKTLLILDSLRGVDSTGIAAIGRDGDARVVKSIGNPFELLEHRMFQPALNRSNRAIIGHNRFATQGGVNRKNAHPFEFDSLVGVHNGTLRNKHKLADSAQFQVDSENLYHHIDKHGLKDALKDLDGAWSLVWWDNTTDSLNFLRNKERPMWITKSSDNEMMFWASEKWMLEVALTREGIKPQEIIETVEDMHYSFDINQKAEISKPFIRHMPSGFKPFVHVPFQGHQQGNGKWSATQSTSTTTQTGTNAQTTLKLVPPVEEKKSNSGEQSSTATRSFYVNSKSIVLELLDEQTDTHGAKFLPCFDSLMPYNKVRLYFKPGDPIRNWAGRTITADIKDIKLHKKEGTYYKVNRDSVKEVEIVDVTSFEELIQQDEVIDFNAPILNHRGKEISPEQFNITYGCCDCCSGLVDPDKKFKFTQNGGAICHECAADKEVCKYISLM